ncbi:MAG: Ricin-type beta-trefoil lectin domain-like [Thermoanaerobaculia bacterium]|jgi:hypothetical protein|nr:Ricin-type beta-trefoil lectin domain-like [Thermoanaerobaculia bacterium]
MANDMGDYYFLKSKRDGDVVDVTGARTAAGTPVVAFPPNTPRTDNQLWGFVVSEKPPYLFITVKQTGQVIDIDGASDVRGTALVTFPRKPTRTDNQLWMLVPSDETYQYFFITSKLARGSVITLELDRQPDGTPLVIMPRRVSANSDQLWSLVTV